MPQTLTELSVDEISLVDRPANAEIDPKTGRKIPRATVALFKRDTEKDDPGTQNINPKDKKAKKEKKKMGIIKKCLQAIDSGMVRKDDAPITKASFNEALRKAGVTKNDFATALQRLADKGTTMDKAMLSPKGAKLYAAYCDADDEGIKVEKRMRPATKAEGELDERARKRMKKNPGMSYAKALTQELDDNPNLYTEHCKQLEAGATYEVPEFEQAVR